MKRTLGCVVVALVLFLVLGAGLIVWVSYNSLVGSEQEVRSQWAQVENVYQRRADLIPNLVATVRGAADFERDTLNDVVQARSRVGQISAEGILEDPQRFARFEAAQDQLSSALSRLLVVVERYPELRSVAAFRDLMVQLEGAENRISVERRRFNEVARAYNTRVRRFPANMLISMLGWPFDEIPYFEAQPGAQEVPRVEF